MVQLKEKIRDELAGRFGIRPEELVYLAGGREDSDGIVYTCGEGKEKKVLKICAKEEKRAVERARMKLELAHFLGEQGVCVAYPKSTKDGEVFQTLEEGKYIYYGSVMDFIEGDMPKTEEITDTVAKAWGSLIGKAHRAAKQYEIWNNMPGSSYEWGHEEEIDSFYEWCRNDIVKAKWKEIKDTMSSWEKNRDSYGFIHNDNHQNNIIVKKDQITLIDFDCAECQFFLQDLFVPIQGMLFDKAGGFNRPLVDMEPVRRFYDQFLAGYEQENHIEDVWLKRMQTALDYRRVLLFTVMQGWMEADEIARNSFLRMIEDPCEFTIL